MTETQTFQQASKFERGLAFAGLMATAAGLVVVKFVNPTSTSLFPNCPFHAMTGLNCPGCGVTRGIHALLNGDVLTALHFNLLLVIIIPALIYAIYIMVAVSFRGRPLTLPKQSPTVVYIVLVIFLVFAVLRNLPFYPFSLLAI
jgi:Protein of unknown function (DUF2752)